MERSDFAQLRVMLLSGKTHGAQTLRSVLSLAGITNILFIDDPRKALDLLTMDNFDAVYADDNCEKVSDLTFAMAVRRRGGILNPMIPIFVFQEQARRSDVEEARDTGATDFLTCPISPRTVMTKLEAALVNPRPFIKAPDFFGPDRRAKARPAWSGDERRSRVARKVNVEKGGKLPSDPVLL
jgi:two-component system, chemotaxis family, chemotaxis protein CheY